MAVRAFTADPDSLLSEVRKAVSDGSITTWEIDSEGDFTHTSSQWRNRAWMRPRVLEDRLVFNIIAPKEVAMTRSVYAFYHGHLIQTLLSHFDRKMKTVSATAKGTADDQY